MLYLVESFLKLLGPSPSHAPNPADVSIECNPGEQAYSQIAQEIVDTLGWDNSAQDYAIWTRSLGPDNFKLFVAMHTQRHNSAAVWPFGQASKKVPIGSVSVALYEGVAHFSMFYVNEKFRGAKIGLELAKQMQLAAGNRAIFCYGVEEMWPKYASRMGLDQLADWRIWSFLVDCRDVLPGRLEQDQSEVELKEWRQVPFERISAFDRVQTAGVDRDAFLREALAHPESLTKIALDRQTQSVVGMCQVRQTMNRRLGISYFYAQNSSIASTLLGATMVEFAGERPAPRFTQLIYKTPSSNTESVRLLRQLVGGKVLDWMELMPQFSKGAIPFRADRIYSIGDEHASLI